MLRAKKRTWLLLVAPLVACVPCLLAPIALLVLTTVISALGGTMTGSLALGAAVFLVGAAVVVVWVRRRLGHRSVIAACSLGAQADDRETALHP